jgi:peptidyl-tRNA hydrolase
MNMTADTPSAPAAPLPSGRFTGRVAFQQLVRDALATAARDGWLEIILADASFEDWPLGERVVDESLHAWSRQGRRIVLMARNYDEVERRHARFVRWRRQWSHIIEARGCRQADPLDFPSAIWSPHWVLRRLDLEHSNGVTGSEPDRRVQLREHLNEWLHKCSPAFAASTLGL